MQGKTSLLASLRTLSGGGYGIVTSFFLLFNQMRARIGVAVLIPQCLAAAIRQKRHLLSRPAALGGVALMYHPCYTDCQSITEYCQYGWEGDLGLRNLMMSSRSQRVSKDLIHPPTNKDQGSRSSRESQCRSFEVHTRIGSCKSNRRRQQIEAASPSGASHAAKVVRGESASRSDRQRTP